MKTSRWISLGMFTLALALATTASTKQAQGEDILKVAPDNTTLILENEFVRVLESRTNPGEKEPMHAHPAYLVYNLTDYTIRFTGPDGISTTVDAKKGQAAYFGALSHAVENVGTTESRALVIEFKDSAKAGD